MSLESVPELISFKVCPFVQRSAIILKEKNVEFNTTYVDLKNLPNWFAKVSPLGKVPVLKVNDSVVFESAVIAEYLDELYAPKLHPDDLLIKAQHRSWTEFASDITMNMFQMLHAGSEEAVQELKNKLIAQFSQVEKVIDKNGVLFAGDVFSLVDTSYAPIFLRISIIDKFYKLNIFDGSGRIGKWSSALLNRDSVKQSVVEDFEAVFMNYTKNSDGFIGQQI